MCAVMRLCTVVLWLTPCCFEPSWLYGKDGGPSNRSVKWHRPLRGAELPEEELYHKVYQSPRLPRVLLKPNSQSGRLREHRSGNVGYRIPGIPHHTVQQQDTNRRETVKKLIQQFENHPNKEFFLQDLNKTEEITTFSERSKKLITDMGNTEIFELCETSSKKQCPIVFKHRKLESYTVHMEKV